MKLELNQSLSIKNRFEQICDALIDAIVSVQDYLLFKHVTFFEGFIYLFAAFRAVWFTAFGVESTSFNYFFPDIVWIIAFWIITVAHTIGFFTRKFKIRILAAYGHGFAWSFLLLLAVYSRTNAPAVPSLLVLTLFALMMIVRLSRQEDLERNEK